MALLTFPLSLDAFFHLLPISGCRIDMPEAMDVSETSGGELLRADLGTLLWAGDIDLSVMLHDEAAEVRPLINLLRRAGGAFLVSDASRPWPRLDPQGLMLLGAAPVIAAVGASTRELSLGGLPAGYRLSCGDLVSFQYGIGPRHALHEVVESVSASSVGVTGLFEVSPPIRPGASVGGPVQLIYPHCKATLKPGTADLGTSHNTVTRDAKFSWSQTLR